MRSPYKYFLLTLLIIIIDHAIKLAVHFNMEPGPIGEIKIIKDFVKLHYITNPGMAFGITLNFAYGKLFLTIFRLIAMFGIGYYLVKVSRTNVKSGLLWCIALILGGAIGNLVDSIFYGKFLNNAPDGTTNPWFQGQVIDMFFFDFWDGTLPEWIPYFGGTYYSTPIFNFADASIFVGVMLILIFQGSFFSEKESTINETIETQPDSISEN
jgi:signal peptidase II